MTHASNVTGAIQPASAVGHDLPAARRSVSSRCRANFGASSAVGRRTSCRFVGRAGTQRFTRTAGNRRALHASGNRRRVAKHPAGRHRHQQRRRSPARRRCPTNTNRAITTCQAWSVWQRRWRGSKTAALRTSTITSSNSPSDLRSGLRQIAGVRIFGGNTAGGSAAVVSITIEGYDPQEVAAVLDANFGIQVRAGLHCAPRMHRALGTIDRGGTVRFSIGAFNTPDEIDAAIAAIADSCC